MKTIQAEINSAQYRILLVDSDLAELIHLRGRLRKQFPSSKFTICRNVEDALRELNEAEIDIVLTDLLMPDLNASDLIHEMMADEKLKDIPVMVTTQSSMSSIIIQFLRPKVAAFFSKPAKTEVLAAYIHACLHPSDTVTA